MHDLQFIRDHPEDFDTALARRGLPPCADTLLEADRQLRAAKTELQELQTRRNALSGQIGQLIREGEQQKAEAIKNEVASFKEVMGKKETAVARIEADLQTRLSEYPNMLSCDVPAGEDETANREIRRVGEKPVFEFPARDHVAIGQGLALMDFEAAAMLSGARFVVLRGQLARLERALAAFMLDLHTRHFGYSETYVPLLVRDRAVYGTGQLPKFAEDLFRVGESHWLIPTAEVALTNLVAGTMLEATDLPIRLTAHTSCFRSEAGAAGKDTQGMIRQHQFGKVELVSIVAPDQSPDEHERMTLCAEEVLKRLALPYRVVTLCAGDTGFAAQKTYDIEVWLPGQGQYREISSCSNCGDFQARRMGARYRDPEHGEPGYVHTLNGSGLAVGRTLIAVLENGQTRDGSVDIPEVLQPYMGGLKRLSPPHHQDRGFQDIGKSGNDE